MLHTAKDSAFELLSTLFSSGYVREGNGRLPDGVPQSKRHILSLPGTSIRVSIGNVVSAMYRVVDGQARIITMAPTQDFLELFSPAPTPAAGQRLIQ